MDVAKPRSKYSFAFCNPLYSDCLLNLYTDGSKDDGCGPRAVPASSVVLAANSRFFKKMLSGNFKESSNKTSIDIHLEAPSDDFFMDLLRFMHTETLPPEASSSLPRATELLILADRFEVEECVVACARELKSLLPISSSQDALLVLSLPQSLREDPRLKEVVEAASLCLVIHSSIAMHQAGLENLKLIQVLYPKLKGELKNDKVEPMHLPSYQETVQVHQCTRQARQELLEYPEAAMQAVLESKRLRGDSEDSVANAALAWAMHRSPSPEQFLDTLFSFVLPRLCLRSLSPSLLQGLLSLLIRSCFQADCGCKQISPALSAGMADAQSPPPSPGMSPSTPTTAAASESPLHSLGASAINSPRASQAARQSNGASHARSQGMGTLRIHDPLVDALVGRDNTSTRASDGEHQRDGRGLQVPEFSQHLRPAGPVIVDVPWACHPPCSSFLASGQGVLPVCAIMCQGATARPKAVAAALGVFADAMVDLSEQNFVRTGVLAKGRSFSTHQAQVPLVPLPREAALPSGCLYLDLPWRIAGTPLIARGYPASNRNLVVTTPDVFASGRWLKLAVYLNDSNSPRLQVYLEKSAEMRWIRQSALEAGTQWRFCLQTSSSQPAFESFAGGTLSDQEQSTCVGSIPLHDAGKDMYFSQNMLRMRVDTWST